MKKNVGITILGGGLAVGYYAKKNGLNFTIYEANERIGGNCVTFKHKDFLFDSGAHRFHDKDAEITEEIKSLLGKELRKINLLSGIYHKGKLLEFPLSPFDLMKKLEPGVFAKIILSVMGS